MQIETLLLKDLIPYANNPRKNKVSIDAVIESIKLFGYTQPILIDNRNVIVAGHSRYQACRKLKIKEVPCIRLTDLSEDQLKAYRIVDNSTGDIAGWDYEKLQIEFDGLEDFNFELMGLTEQEMFKCTLTDFEDDEELNLTERKLGNKSKKVCPHCGMEI